MSSISWMFEGQQVDGKISSELFALQKFRCDNEAHTYGRARLIEQQTELSERDKIWGPTTIGGKGQRLSRDSMTARVA